MLDDASDLAAHRVAFAPAQILDLLGDVLAVETVVGDHHRAQHHRLMLRPGEEVVVVARSIRHVRQPLKSYPHHIRGAAQSASVGSAFCERAARRVISATGADSKSSRLPRMTKLSPAP